MKILVIEDEEKLRRVIQLHLSSHGHDVSTTAVAEDALWQVSTETYDLILTDLKLPGMDGLSLLDSIHHQKPELPVIVMTAFSNVETAVDAMKKGATDFLQKPFSLDHLTTIVDKALEVGRLKTENQILRQQLTARYQFGNLIGRSPAMQEVFSLIERIAPSRATVLLCGESGVGKDMVARAIHWHSPRKAHAMVKINCSALPENLMESELFGYERGAFTGANLTKLGKFEQADGSTVFLDEIGDVPLPLQVKLLRILQEREFERLGSNKTRAVDVRVIAATNVDLRQAMDQGRFREDLYYRLNVMPINIPPLRQRQEDIPALAQHFLTKYGRPGQLFTPAALDKLLTHDWPGNVRELENVIERSLLLATTDALSADSIRLDANPKTRPTTNPTTNAAPSFLPPNMTLDQYEQSILKEAIKRAQGNKSQAARLLGITRNALRYRLTQMGLPDDADKD
jgi:DNA-binding NtrC family response regulator